MRWEEFASHAPELAALAQQRFDRMGLALLGTLRKDGSPRISPCEPYITEGELLLGMMPDSMKALDLLRDPRIVVHSTVSDREGTEGDVKLYGRAVNLTDDAAWRDRYGDATEARIGWRPTGRFHLFTVDIASAGFALFGPERYGLAWSPERGLRRLPIAEDPEVTQA
jgi:Pyridoxamine 5'-phosphate oxidase